MIRERCPEDLDRLCGFGEALGLPASAPLGRDVSVGARTIRRRSAVEADAMVQ